ncbi:MAG: hypothetical protein ABIB43_03735 [archaeon]
MVARNKIIVGLGILLIIAFSVIIGATITELTPEDETWTNNATLISYSHWTTMRTKHVIWLLIA